MTGQQLDWSVWGRCPATGKVRLGTLEGTEKYARRCQHLSGKVMRYCRCSTCHSYHLQRISEVLTRHPCSVLAEDRTKLDENCCSGTLWTSMGGRERANVGGPPWRVVRVRTSGPPTLGPPFMAVSPEPTKYR